MNYQSGEEIRLGDHVLIEQGRTKGTVVQIIESNVDMDALSLDEKGVMLFSEPFGAIFWPIEYSEDPIRFVSRGNA